jgi:LEA14-like dessication related protein
MPSLMSGNLRRETQTGRSAFFCARPRIASRIVVALFLLSISADPVFASEENKPAVQLKGVSVEAIDWNERSAQATLLISIDNPGPALKLKDLSYRLKLNDSQAAEGKYDKEIEVPAHSGATFSLPCRVDLSAMPGVAWGIIAGGFDVHYELETEFTVQLPMLNPRIKTSLGGNLSLSATVLGWSAKIRERVSTKQ